MSHGMDERWIESTNERDDGMTTMTMMNNDYDYDYGTDGTWEEVA